MALDSLIDDLKRAAASFNAPESPTGIILLIALFVLAVEAFGKPLRRFRRKSLGGGWRSKSSDGNYPNDKRLFGATEQLPLVMQSHFEKRPLLSKTEVRVFHATEKAIQALNLNWRVMAQVSLGEVLFSPDPAAHSCINSKRVDVLIVSANGEPIAAIEYQGSGHYLGNAAARDAVKKEALRRAGVEYIEVKPGDCAKDVARGIARLASPVAPRSERKLA